MGKRGQVSFEYIVIAGILLIITLPFFYYAFNESNNTIKLNQADDAVQSIARAADSVYSLGPGSKQFITISIPDGVLNSSVSSKTVQVQLGIYGGISDIYSVTKANLTGGIPTSRGTYRLSLEMLPSGLVAIGNFNDTGMPSVIWSSPSGNQLSNDTTLQVNTNEAGFCRFAPSDIAFSSMPNLMAGTSLTHTYYLGQQAEGNYLYYVRCNDSSGNVMNSSSLINYTINVTSDTIAPVVSNSRVNQSSAKINEYICVNATATDNGAVTQVKALFTTPFDVPFQKLQNFTLLDTGNCSGAAGDSVYGAAILMQGIGNWTLNRTYAVDDDGNVGFQDVLLSTNVSIIVTENGTIVNGSTIIFIFNALNYSAVHSALYFSSSPNASINQSSLSKTDITTGMIDDDQQTPSASYKFKLNAQSYEGLIVQLNESPHIYNKTTVRIKFDGSDALPYNVTIWGYLADGDRLNMGTAVNVSITHIRNINNYDRGDNEFDITNITKTAGFSYIKVRIAPTSKMNGLRADFTEADIGRST